MNSQIGKVLIFLGIVVVLIGVLVYFFHNKMQWLGRLPGDIRVEKDNFRFYFPFTSMVLLSILATIIINILKKFF